MNPEDFPTIHKILDDTIAATEMLLGAVVDDPVIHARTKGVGILTPEDALAYGTLGPTVRASGLEDDVRTDDPYAAYDQLEWKVCTWDSCDVFGKAAVRLLETIESCKICKQVLDKIPDGPIAAEVRNFPVGEGLGHAEAPRGEVFHFVKSNGGNKPIRHKVRAPSHVNIPSYKATCQGERISDVALISAAVDPCYCCTERMSVVERGSDKAILTGEDLVRMSQEDTRKIYSQLGRTTPIDRLGEKLGLRKK
jgi:NADH-quinone oxidoreductase subunit D